MTMIAHAALERATAEESWTDPAALLNRADSVARQMLPDTDRLERLATSMDIGLCSVDWKTRKVHFPLERTSIFSWPETARSLASKVNEAASTIANPVFSRPGALTSAHRRHSILPATALPIRPGEPRACPWPQRIHGLAGTPRGPTLGRPGTGPAPHSERIPGRPPPARRHHGAGLSASRL